MNTWNPKANELFLQALELPTPGPREEFLDEVCQDDTALRAEVEALLDAGEQAGSFLESPALAPKLDATVDRPLAERPGTTIGPYKLLEQIGEGGFGAVFMAEQTEPVRRKVAVKVLKPGMDSRQVVARFEAERQALALMDHPHIAKVLDGGTTKTGRPYFVMELVRGAPITEFCDQNCMTIRQRLELFVDVCQAVQHAHQKGIIHRDIKPSNVMVTLHDGEPVVKVIDFGVAKALGQRLTEKTLFTNFAQMIGTPLYMSPEQAEMSGLDVDTRSDIYSLGVLLYELLTGSTPFESERFSKVGYDEMRRIIRQEEPPKPSARISTVNKLATTVSQKRQGDPRKLSHSLRGELDWIAMKALEKDRDRRYETASAFAADVQRYLHDEPVQACPPSVLYRFQKFAGRNKGAFATVGLLGLMLLLGVVLLVVDNAQIKEEQRRAEDQKRRAETALNQAEDNLQLADENLELALESLDEVYMTEIETRVHRNRELSPADQEFLQKGLRFYEEFGKRNSCHAGLHGATAKANRRAGYLRLELEQYQQAEAHFRKAIPLLEKLRAASAAAEYRRELASAQRGLLTALRSLGRFQEAETAGRQSIDLYRQIMAEFPPTKGDRAQLGQCLLQLHLVLDAVGRPRDSEALAREALSVCEQLAADFPEEPHHRQETAYCCRILGDSLDAQARIPEAVENYQRAVSIYTGLAEEFPSMPFYRHALAFTYFRLGQALQADQQTEQAEKAYRQAVVLQERLVEEAPPFADHRGRLRIFNIALAGLIVQQGRYAEAAKLAIQQDDPWLLNAVAWSIVSDPDAPPQAAVEAVELARKSVEIEPFPINWNTLGVAQYRAGDYSAAIDTLLKAEEMFRGWNFSFNAFFLAMAHWKLGDKEQARKWYGPALVWMERHASQDEELLFFRAETAALLGLTEKLTPEQEAAKADDVKFYTLVVEARRDAAWAYVARGSALAERGQGQEAAADFAKAVETKQGDPITQALACLQCGDVARYRKLCGDMLAPRDSAAKAYAARQAVSTCALGPDAVSDWKPVVELAEKEVAAEHNSFDTQQRLGAVLYRAGRFHDAAGWLTKAETKFRTTNDAGSSIVYTWLFRAMTEHRLSHAENAKTYLEQAVRAIEQPPQDGTATLWNQRMVYQILRREAEDELMKPPGGEEREGAPSDDDWRIVKAQTRAGTVVGETTRADEMRQRAADLPSEQSGDSELQHELARSHSELAKSLLRRGKRGEAAVEWNNAAAEYQKVVEQRPDAWESWSGLAFAHFHQQQWEDAVAAFSKAIERNPAVHRNWWHRGHCYLNLEQWDKAATEFGYIVEHWPNGSAGWYLRAVALTQLNRPEEALADLRQAIAQGFDDVQLMQEDSRIEPLRAREDFRELLQEFERTQVQHQANLALERRQLAEEEAKLSAAIRQSRRLAAERTGDSELQYELARSHSELAKFLQGQGKRGEATVEWNNAAAVYRKAIEQWPDAWEGWSGLAFVHEDQQQWEEAVAAFSKAIERNPAVLKNWWRRGNCYLNLEQWDKAATEFGYIVDHWPGGGGGWYLRGVALAQLNRADEALADLRQAIAKGFHNVQLMQKDPRLESLRTREDFAALLKELEGAQKTQVQQDGG